MSSSNAQIPARSHNIFFDVYFHSYDIFVPSMTRDTFSVHKNVCVSIYHVSSVCPQYEEMANLNIIFFAFYFHHKIKYMCVRSMFVMRWSTLLFAIESHRNVWHERLPKCIHKSYKRSLLCRFIFFMLLAYLCNKKNWLEG